MSVQEERASSSAAQASAEEEESAGPIPIQKIEVSIVLFVSIAALFYFNNIPQTQSAFLVVALILLLLIHIVFSWEFLGQWDFCE